MKDEIVSFKTAKLAFEKGFDIWDASIFRYSLENEEYSDGYIHGDIIPAPSQTYLQKFLREIHNIHLQVDTCFNEDKTVFFRTSMFKNWEELVEMTMEHIDETRPLYTTYEEALEAVLVEVLNRI